MINKLILLGDTLSKLGDHGDDEFCQDWIEDLSSKTTKNEDLVLFTDYMLDEAIDFLLDRLKEVIAEEEKEEEEEGNVSICDQIKAEYGIECSCPVCIAKKSKG